MLEGKKIFITTASGIGDIIMYTPALRRLKELCPTCEITFMTLDNRGDVIKKIPYIDKIAYVKRGRFMGRYRILPILFKQDIVIFTDWQPHILPFSWLFRIKIRSGIPREGHILSKCLTHHLINNIFQSTRYAAETNAMILSESLGMTIDGDMTQCDVSMPGNETQKEVDHLLSSIGIERNDSFLLLTPFTGFERRNWPSKEVEEFVRLTQTKLNIPVVVTGIFNTEQEKLKGITYDLFNKTTILQLIELIRRANCVITPDSGPMHIAGALGTYVIPLFSKDLPSRWAPKKKCFPIYLKCECSPCDDKTAKNCQTVKCMKGITAEMVYTKLIDIQQTYHLF